MVYHTSPGTPKKGDERNPGKQKGKEKEGLEKLRYIFEKELYSLTLHKEGLIMSWD